MSTKENPAEEIDLGQLFKLIGNGLNKLFQFIVEICKGLFHVFIVFLLFIQKHFLKFVVIGLVGVSIGWYWDAVTAASYRSSMIVQPNFNSTQQLYNNVEFYNDLAEEEAYKTLAAALKISDKEAETITRIEIEAFTDDNQKLKQFSDFVSILDSTSRSSLSYKDYLENFNNIQARFHKIELDSKNPEVAKKCQNAIVRSIENNKYFKTQKTTNDLNIKLSEITIEEQLKQIDSLKVFYQELKILELRKPEGTSGTSINLASDNKSLDRSEITLLDRAKSLKNETQSLNRKKADSENIINVISDFPEKGGRVNDLLEKKKVLLPLFLFIISVIVLGMLSLNRYLRNYNKNQ